MLNDDIVLKCMSAGMMVTLMKSTILDQNDSPDKDLLATIDFLSSLVQEKSEQYMSEKLTTLSPVKRFDWQGEPDVDKIVEYIKSKYSSNSIIDIIISLQQSIKEDVTDGKSGQL